MCILVLQVEELENSDDAVDEAPRPNFADPNQWGRVPEGAWQVDDDPEALDEVALFTCRTHLTAFWLELGDSAFCAGPWSGTPLSKSFLCSFPSDLCHNQEEWVFPNCAA